MQDPNPSVRAEQLLGNFKMGGQDYDAAPFFSLSSCASGVRSADWDGESAFDASLQAALTGGAVVHWAALMDTQNGHIVRHFGGADPAPDEEDVAYVVYRYARRFINTQRCDKAKVSQVLRAGKDAAWTVVLDGALGQLLRYEPRDSPAPQAVSPPLRRPSWPPMPGYEMLDGWPYLVVVGHPGGYSTYRTERPSDWLGPCGRLEDCHWAALVDLADGKVLARWKQGLALVSATTSQWVYVFQGHTGPARAMRVDPDMPEGLRRLTMGDRWHLVLDAAGLIKSQAAPPGLVGDRVGEARYSATYLALTANAAGVGVTVFPSVKDWRLDWYEAKGVERRYWSVLVDTATGKVVRRRGLDPEDVPAFPGSDRLVYLFHVQGGSACEAWTVAREEDNGRRLESAADVWSLVVDGQGRVLAARPKEEKGEEAAPPRAPSDAAPGWPETAGFLKWGPPAPRRHLKDPMNRRFLGLYAWAQGVGYSLWAAKSDWKPRQHPGDLLFRDVLVDLHTGKVVGVDQSLTLPACPDTLRGVTEVLRIGRDGDGVFFETVAPGDRHGAGRPAWHIDLLPAHFYEEGRSPEGVNRWPSRLCGDLAVDPEAKGQPYVAVTANDAGLGYSYFSSPDFWRAQAGGWTSRHWSTLISVASGCVVGRDFRRTSPDAVMPPDGLWLWRSESCGLQAGLTHKGAGLPTWVTGLDATGEVFLRARIKTTAATPAAPQTEAPAPSPAANGTPPRREFVGVSAYRDGHGVSRPFASKSEWERATHFDPSCVTSKLCRHDDPSPVEKYDARSSQRLKLTFTGDQRPDLLEEALVALARHAEGLGLRVCGVVRESETASTFGD
jgi:hypothetical protein